MPSGVPASKNPDGPVPSPESNVQRARQSGLGRLDSGLGTLDSGLAPVRVIAGDARGVPLVAPTGTATRPTSDLLKGAMFSMLGPRGGRGRVLDLFAGSGALGIEALSRGADWCDFVESVRAACQAIEANLAKTKFTAQGRVHCLPVQRWLAQAGRLGSERPYDLLLADPPYALEGQDAA